jgi:hypothetical protein
MSMKINRSFLLQKLADFVQEGHGVIIGKPGVGKSYLIKELKRFLINKEVLSFIVRIDATEDASDTSIEKDLGLDLNWIDAFKKVKIEDNQKAVLFFDAFDAARDEKLRLDYLRQIKKAKMELSDKWNIIVSVRTYDATKSPELIKLFPASFRNEGVIGCRNIEIPKLSVEELNKAIEKEAQLKEVYDNCTDQLREVLLTPYFLTLLEKILQAEATDKNVLEIRAIKSEIQLLDRYWLAKVIGSHDSVFREKLLYRITNEQVNSKTLSILKSELLYNSTAQELETFDYLRSENILEEFSINNNRVGYSHNILFDYAVSRLCISEEINELLSFIRFDTTRPFFFRPSFTYFFTGLWHKKRPLFWDIYWKLFNSPDKEIQLSLKLILNTIASTEFETLEDLKEITSKEDRLTRSHAIKQLLQSLIFLRENRLNSSDSQFIHFLSSNLSFEYLQEFSYLLQKLTECSDFEPRNCGLSARNFFNFILTNRNKPESNKAWLDRLGSTRGVSLICITYESDISSSKALLENVLQFLQEPTFDIWYFTTLTDKLDPIAIHDAPFVAKIYRTIFNHKELSDTQTSMGTVALNLLSNRRQDFDMCYFSLIQYYPKFLISNPRIAIELGLSIVTRFIIEDKFQVYGIKPKVEEFRIGELECELFSDMSLTWHDHLGYNSPAQMGEEIINYFDSELSSGNPKIVCDYLPIFFKNAKPAYCWKKLIELGVKYPNELKDILFPIPLTNVILLNEDIIYEVSSFIEATARLYMPNQLIEIEIAITNILVGANLHDDTIEFLEGKVSRLLNCIPYELIQLEKSKEFLSHHKKILNEPPFKPSWSSEPVTTELWLQRKGVDPTNPVHSNILKQINTLEVFNNKWLNGTPQRTEYLDYLSCAKFLYNSMMATIDPIDPKLIYTSLKEVARTCSLVCRSTSVIEKSELEIISTILEYCFNFESQYDKEIDENMSPAGGYSATPRIEAAEALAHLASINHSNKFLSIYTSAVNDKHPIVRFNAIKYLSLIKKRYPNEYWAIAFHRLKEEKDSFTSSVLLGNIFLDSYEDNSLIEKVLKIASERKDAFAERSSFTDNYTTLLLKHSTKGNQTATEIIYQNISNSKFCKQLVYKIFDFLDPGHPFNKYEESNQHNFYLFKLLNDIIIENGKILTNLSDAELKKENPSIKSALELFDSIIQQIYFSLDIREGRRKKDRLPVSEKNRIAFYFKIKPLLLEILSISKSTTSEGLVIGHTAYYFSQLLNGVLSYDPKDVLGMVNQITMYSYRTGYTFDSSSIEEIVRITEKIFADHRSLLLEKESFDNLIGILDIYVQSGWTRAIELLWKLDDIFR